MLHGFITWGIAAMLTVYLQSSAIGGIIGGGASALIGFASAAGNGIKDAAQPVAQAAGVTSDIPQQQIQGYLKPAKNASDATASAAAKTSFAAFVTLLIGAAAAAVGGSLAVQRRRQTASRVVR